MLASPIAKPFPNSPHFSLPPVSQKQSKPTLLNKARSYNHQFKCLLTWNIINRVGHCLHENSTKICITVRKHIKLFNNPTPWNLTRLPHLKQFSSIFRNISLGDPSVLSWVGRKGVIQVFKRLLFWPNWLPRGVRGCRNLRNVWHMV